MVLLFVGGLSAVASLCFVWASSCELGWGVLTGVLLFYMCVYCIWGDRGVQGHCPPCRFPGQLQTMVVVAVQGSPKGSHNTLPSTC